MKRVDEIKEVGPRGQDAKVEDSRLSLSFKTINTAFG